jgi:hypothetical protein
MFLLKEFFMRPFSLGIKIENQYVEILVQEFSIAQSHHYQCTVGNSIIFWISETKNGYWQQLDGTDCVLAQTIGEKIQQFKSRHSSAL